MLVCDACGVDEGNASVSRRTLKVNAREVEVEVCDSDWPGDQLSRILKAGRKPGSLPRVVE